MRRTSYHLFVVSGSSSGESCLFWFVLGQSSYQCSPCGKSLTETCTVVSLFVTSVCKCTCTVPFVSQHIAFVMNIEIHNLNIAVTSSSSFVDRQVL